MSDREFYWLRQTCSYFTPEYLHFLMSYRFKPEQIRMNFNPISEDGDMGNIEIEAVGPWAETILWEVPLMACLSELYFRTVDTDWNYDGQEGTYRPSDLYIALSNFAWVDAAYDKAKILLNRGCVFSEFGTRRRRSYSIQDLVVRTLKRASQESPSTGHFFGTSNVRDEISCYGIALIERSTGSFGVQAWFNTCRDDCAVSFHDVRRAEFLTLCLLVNGSWLCAILLSEYHGS